MIDQFGQEPCLFIVLCVLPHSAPANRPVTCSRGGDSKFTDC